jgi:hypothetical protein
MRSLFSATRDTPGVCSPSRRVVSKNFMVLGKRLNKAIPHLNHIFKNRVKQRYKNYGLCQAAAYGLKSLNLSCPTQ